jgi:hypothetical protein
LNVGSTWGGLGLAANYLDFGSFPGRDSSGAPAAAYSVRRMGASLGLGFGLGQGLQAGLALRGSQLSAAAQAYAGFAGDLGALWRSGSGLSLGLAYSNLGTAVGGSQQTSSLKAGAAGSFGLGGGRRLLLALDGDFVPSGPVRVQAGAEGWPHPPAWPCALAISTA